MEKRAAIKNFLIPICFIPLIAACSPRVITETKTVIEYRDRVVTDTAVVEIPIEIEKIITKDTVSHLENTYAKSDAVVSKGFLSHSLESKPQYIKVPVEVHVTDTLWKESEIKTEVVEVEKKLSWWKKFRLDAFWPLIGAVILLILWTLRKLKLIF